MNADASPTMAWFGMMIAAVICFGFTLLGLGAAIAFLVRSLSGSNRQRRDNRVAIARPAAESARSQRGPGSGRALGAFALLLLGLAGLAAVLCIVLAAITEPSHRIKGAAWLLTFVILLLSLGALWGFALLTRKRRPSEPPAEPAGPGYKMMVAAWLLGGVAMLAVGGFALYTSNRHTPNADEAAQLLLGLCFTPIPVALIAATSFRYVWVNRRRLGESIMYAHEPASRKVAFDPATGARSPMDDTFTRRQVMLALAGIGGIVLGIVLLFGNLGFRYAGKPEDAPNDREFVLFLVGSASAIVLGIFALARSNSRLEAASRQPKPVEPQAAVPPPLPRSCPKCGAALAPDAAQGLCPRCLLQQMMPVPERLSPTIAHGPFVPPTVEEVAEFFPQFEILRIVGQGGMGAVYLARQKALDRMVALKLIRTAKEDDPTFAERFAREARAMAKLSHPNIVSVHDTGEAGGLPYLVMEYVDGVTLRDAIRTKSLTPVQALAIIPQICDALDYAHRQGVVHRDIKPENILLDASGKVKIADFGLAKLADPDAMSLTGTMQAMGTPHYMAPEQWEKPTTVDHRADIYALGVVLYELLTGELPLGRFDPPSVKARVDARIDELVLRALAKEPDRRYQHATDVKLALAQIAATPLWGPGCIGPGIREYKSKATLLGWPLVHVTYGRDKITGWPKVAKGWIAVSDSAAIGGLAIGAASAVGGLAIGGGLALGGIALGGGGALGVLAVGGGWAIGGAAVGGGGAVGAGLALGGGFATSAGYACAGGGAYAPVMSSGENPNPEFWSLLHADLAERWEAIVGFFRGR